MLQLSFKRAVFITVRFDQSRTRVRSTIEQSLLSVFNQCVHIEQRVQSRIEQHLLSALNEPVFSIENQRACMFDQNRAKFECMCISSEYAEFESRVSSSHKSSSSQVKKKNLCFFNYNSCCLNGITVVNRRKKKSFERLRTKALFYSHPYVDCNLLFIWEKFCR